MYALLYEAPVNVCQKSVASQVHGHNKSAVGEANALSANVRNECELVLAPFKCRLRQCGSVLMNIFECFMRQKRPTHKFMF